MRTKYVGKWGKEAWVIGDIVNIYLLKQPYHVETWRAASHCSYISFKRRGTPRLYKSLCHPRARGVPAPLHLRLCSASIGAEQRRPKYGEKLGRDILFLIPRAYKSLFMLTFALM